MSPEMSMQAVEESELHDVAGGEGIIAGIIKFINSLPGNSPPRQPNPEYGHCNGYHHHHWHH